MKELSNGWLLGPEGIQENESGGYSATRGTVRAVLEGEVRTITLVCYCQVEEGGNPHYTSFVVETNEDKTRITVGCTDFTPEDIELVKEWLAEKPVTATEGRE